MKKEKGTAQGRKPRKQRINSGDEGGVDEADAGVVEPEPRLRRARLAPGSYADTAVEGGSDDDYNDAEDDDDEEEEEEEEEEAEDEDEEEEEEEEAQQQPKRRRANKTAAAAAADPTVAAPAAADIRIPVAVSAVALYVPQQAAASLSSPHVLLDLGPLEEGVLVCRPSARNKSAYVGDVLLTAGRGSDSSTSRLNLSDSRR